MTTASLRAESAALEALRKVGLAVHISWCMTCGKPFAARLVQPCDGAVVDMTHGICEPCFEVAESAVEDILALAYSDGEAAWEGQ